MFFSSLAVIFVKNENVFVRFTSTSLLRNMDKKKPMVQDNKSFFTLRQYILSQQSPIFSLIQGMKDSILHKEKTSLVQNKLILQINRNN